MKYIELLEAFEIEINKLDDGLTKPKSSDTEWWLNRGLEKFYKTRYSGINFKQKGFELDLKRTDDLRTLIKVEIFKDDAITKISNSEYTINLPDDYIVLLGDLSGILPIDGKDFKCWEKVNGLYVIKYCDTIESRIETIDKQLTNSLSEHKLKYSFARPLKLVLGNNIIFYTDGNYKVAEYKMFYLRKPLYIDIHTEPMNEYNDMPEHTHSEIVKLAALMYLENLANSRYNSISNEVKEME